MSTRNIPSRAEVLMMHEALLKMKKQSPAAQMALAEPDTAFKHLVWASQHRRLVTCGDYGILFDVGSPWHTTKLVLIEEIIIRFRRQYQNPVEEAIAKLDDLARLYGCVAIAAGDTQVGLMAPRYQAAGYTSLGSQFYKELNG